MTRLPRLQPNMLLYNFTTNMIFFDWQIYLIFLSFDVFRMQLQSTERHNCINLLTYIAYA